MHETPDFLEGMALVLADLATRGRAAIARQMASSHEFCYEDFVGFVDQADLEELIGVLPPCRATEPVEI